MISTQEYLKVLEGVVKPWMEEITRGNHHVSSRTGA
jgi:hypothetical protein